MQRKYFHLFFVVFILVFTFIFAKNDLQQKEDNELVDVQFHHDGYLFLASKKNADRLYQNHKIQM